MATLFTQAIHDMIWGAAQQRSSRVLINSIRRLASDHNDVAYGMHLAFHQGIEVIGRPTDDENSAYLALRLKDGPPKRIVKRASCN